MTQISTAQAVGPRRIAVTALVRRLKIAAVIPVALAALAVTASVALAGGTSPKTNGCYAQWWNTAFAGYCTPATASGHYRIFADCKAPQIPDKTGPWVYISKGSTIRPFDSRECRFGIHFARVEFRG